MDSPAAVSAVVALFVTFAAGLLSLSVWLMTIGLERMDSIENPVVRIVAKSSAIGSMIFTYTFLFFWLMASAAKTQ